jgi:hypothetical protein
MYAKFPKYMQKLGVFMPKMAYFAKNDQIYVKMT